NKIWDWAGKIEESQANCQFQVSGPESIILGKNNFSCFKVMLQIQDAQTKGLQLIITRWYADKVGLVKEEDEVFQGDKKINVYYELEDYKVK
ncbi:MAG: hypothetical protein HYU63_07780, partial [Armatimonadetes bacterium]|nr:hypothetical protein [Armatimonadota bacterium]